MTFYETNMVRAVYFLCGTVITTVGFGVRVVANKHTFDRLFEYLGIVSIQYQYEYSTSDLSNVGVVWFPLEP